MAYKLLGYVVWQVAKLVVRRKVANTLSTRNVAAAGVVAVAIAGLVVASRRAD